jgi:hypothetical protein
MLPLLFGISLIGISIIKEREENVKQNAPYFYPWLARVRNSAIASRLSSVVRINELLEMSVMERQAVAPRHFHAFNRRCAIHAQRAFKCSQFC